MGERVIVYETTDEGWAWGQLETDGYVGWLSANALGKPGRAPTHKVAVPRTLGFPGPDIKLPPAVALPMGASVVDRAAGRAFRRHGITAGICRPCIWRRSRRGSRISSPSPKNFSHAPYLWGGKTSLGIDCSGLVQVALQAAGHRLPARQRHAGTGARQIVVARRAAARRSGVLEGSRRHRARRRNLAARQCASHGGGDRAGGGGRSRASRRRAAKSPASSGSSARRQQFGDAAAIERQPLQRDDQRAIAHRALCAALQARVDGSADGVNLLAFGGIGYAPGRARRIDGGEEDGDLLVGYPRRGQIAEQLDEFARRNADLLAAFAPRRIDQRLVRARPARPPFRSDRRVPLARCAGRRNCRISTISSRARSIGKHRHDLAGRAGRRAVCAIGRRRPAASADSADSRGSPWRAAPAATARHRRGDRRALARRA